MGGPIQITQTGLRPIQLKPVTQDTVVAAVDTSSIKIGETRKGILMAIRGANVWKQKRSYRYLRIGPFIFHVTEENREAYDLLEREHLNNSSKNSHYVSPNLSQTPLRMASLLETWQQNMLAKTMKSSVILIDGSLTSGIVDASRHQLIETLDAARRMGSVVLAFSKITSLRLNGYLITDISLEHRPPYLMKIASLKTRPPTVLLGDVYVARMSSAKYAFRLDIDKEVPWLRKIDAVERLLGNDLFVQGYPETLRLAHILCTFTANEVIAMQHFTAQRYNLKIIDRPDMHKILFGPFGKGESR